MKIFLTGLLSLEMHRLENGNIGNWYIASAVLKQLVNQGFEVVTTWQIHDSTLERIGVRDGVQILPIDSTNWTEASVVLEVNGDLWGDNSTLLGEERLKNQLLRTQRAQQEGMRTAIIATSPGPFAKTAQLEQLAREVFESYDLVVCREPYSAREIVAAGFSNSNLHVLPCPSVLFDEEVSSHAIRELDQLKTNYRVQQKIGISISAWNIAHANWDDNEFSEMQLKPITTIVYNILEQGDLPVLISHSNGFSVDSGLFVQTQGRDRKLIDAIIRSIGESASQVFVISDLPPADIWKILGNLDMIIAGRVHAGAAAVAQGVPAQFIFYANGPFAAKVQGFAEIFHQPPSISLQSCSDSTQIIVEAALKHQKAEAQRQDLVAVIRQQSKMQFDLVATLT